MDKETLLIQFMEEWFNRQLDRDIERIKSEFELYYNWFNETGELISSWFEMRDSELQSEALNEELIPPNKNIPDFDKAEINENDFRSANVSHDIIWNFSSYLSGFPEPMQSRLFNALDRAEDELGMDAVAQALEGMLHDVGSFQSYFETLQGFSSEQEAVALYSDILHYIPDELLSEDERAELESEFEMEYIYRYD